MSKRLNLTIVVSVVLGATWLSGCAHSGGGGTSAAVSSTGNGEQAVVDAVRVPTEETRPDDVPAGLVVAEAADPSTAAPTIADINVMDVYRIGPADTLAFRSFDDESLNSNDILVRHDGHISLPWISDLKVAGLTREEATEVVREAYQELYYDAEVSLQIIQATSRSYTVTGDVNRPAEFPYTKPVTLLDAIIAAGSLRVNQRGGDSFVGGQGQLVKAFIIRGTGAERIAHEYDLRNMEKGGNHDTQTLVLPGDTIYIPEGLNLVYVLGEVGRPGIQPLQEGMTLLQLLSSSGGFNESSARMKQIVLIRELDDTETEVKLFDLKKMMKTGGDILIQPGDIVYVPRKRLITLGEFINRSTGLVSPILSVTSQALGLYSQVWDAFYQEERIDLLYNNDNSSQIQTNLQLLDALRQVGSAATALGGAGNP
jgi:polysaccharide biosynthesis/export protein